MGRPRWVAVLLVVLAATACTRSGPPPSAAPRPLGIVVPAYVDPGQTGYWDSLLRHPGEVRAVVLNPQNGPGPRPSDAFVGLVGRLRRAGIGVLGYVVTGYGARPPAEVQGDVDDWQRWYGVGDVFLDEAPAEPAQLYRYRDYTAAVHRGGGTAVLNPGLVPDPGYFRVADAVVTFEDTADRYLGRPPDPPWLRAEPSARVWHIVLDTPEDRLDRVLERAREDGAGRVFITDDRGANPYDRLPAYWSDEVSTAAR